MTKDTSISCEICGNKFSLLSWKRYCPKCNKACCKECLTGRITGANKSESVLICSDCVVIESTTQSISVHEDLEMTGEINRTLRQELKEKVMVLENFRSFLLELCATFGPNSELFPKIGDNQGNCSITDSMYDSTSSITYSIDDENCSITDLITKCQDDFENMQNRIKLLRRQYDSVLLSDQKNKHIISHLNEKLVKIRIERDELMDELSKVEDLIHKLDDQKELYDEVVNERDNLKIRCDKLESALNSSEKSSYNISNTLEDDVSTLGHQRYRMSLLSICCPRLYP